MTITAQLARLLAKQHSLPSLEDAYKVIQDAAKKGETKVFFYKLLTQDEIKELELKGFSVEQGTDRDGVLVTIDWFKKEPILKAPEDLS